MTKYFKQFPIIEYNGRRVRDISRRGGFSAEALNNKYLYMPYTVKEGERAEDIADFYYGSTDYVWLVYYSNNILDPVHDWPFSEYDFNKYLIDKYKDISGEEGEDVIDWTRKETTTNQLGEEVEFTDNVVYYYREV